MKLSQYKRITSVCEALFRLTKLTDLLVDLSENEYFDQQDLDILAVMASDLPSLLYVSMILDKSFFMSLKLFINTTYECMHTVNI